VALISSGLTKPRTALRDLRPCRTEMPEWGKLLLERPDLGLVVINADLVPNEPSAVSAMLAQTGLEGNFGTPLPYDLLPSNGGSRRMSAFRIPLANLSPTLHEAFRHR
jgi:hypothetical protein